MELAEPLQDLPYVASQYLRKLKLAPPLLASWINPRSAVAVECSNQSLKGKAVDLIASADRFLIVVQDNNAIGFRH